MYKKNKNINAKSLANLKGKNKEDLSIVKIVIHNWRKLQFEIIQKKYDNYDSVMDTYKEKISKYFMW